MKKLLCDIASMYVEGFRNMTWGKVLWVLIIAKLVILFGIFRPLLFKPDMADKTDEQKSEIVGKRLSETPIYDKQLWN